MDLNLSKIDEKENLALYREFLEALGLYTWMREMGLIAEEPADKLITQMHLDLATIHRRLIHETLNDADSHISIGDE